MKGARWDPGPKKITIITITIIIMVIRKVEQLFNKSWWMGFFISEEKTFSTWVCVFHWLNSQLNTIFKQRLSINGMKKVSKL